MIKIKKRERIILICIGAVLFAFIVERLVISGMISKMKATNMQIRVQEEQLKQALGIEKDKARISEEYKKYSPYLLADTQDREIVAKFLKEIENITQSSGVLVVNLTPENQPEQTQGYKKFRADLKAEANAEQLFNFLFKIQDCGLLVRLDKLSISPKNEDASSLRIETTISIAVP